MITAWGRNIRAIYQYDNEMRPLRHRPWYPVILVPYSNAQERYLNWNPTRIVVITCKLLFYFLGRLATYLMYLSTLVPSMWCFFSERAHPDSCDALKAPRLAGMGSDPWKQRDGRRDGKLAGGHLQRLVAWRKKWEGNARLWWLCRNDTVSTKDNTPMISHATRCHAKDLSCRKRRHCHSNRNRLGWSWRAFLHAGFGGFRHHLGGRLL